MEDGDDNTKDVDYKNYDDIVNTFSSDIIPMLGQMRLIQQVEAILIKFCNIEVFLSSKAININAVWNTIFFFIYFALNSNNGNNNYICLNYLCASGDNSKYHLSFFSWAAKFYLCLFPVHYNFIHVKSVTDLLRKLRKIPLLRRWWTFL